ncbi:hypothetical protein TL18_06275 [Methanobrevibacter sp. YE315]|nr:zinc ribbon domain-containing protein [Methanobrevibacter sp. YE315]AMD17661.1 hypothetical protein TL18_06275 [Methanobrevibacter sp. YE315]
MKCKECGFENKSTAKFCTKCGVSLVNTTNENTQNSSNSTKYVIIALVIIIIILVATVGYFALANNSNANADTSSKNPATSQVSSSQGSSGEVSTESVSSSSSPSKSWVNIGSYSGSGSGSQVIDVPAGEIKVELSAYPIKNYATNHLYVSGSNGQSGGVDWGSTSAVETRSDSFSYSSSSSQTFTIDYYETVEWQVNFYRYQ